MIILTKLSDLRISHLTKAVEDAGNDKEIFIQYDCYGGKPSNNLHLMRQGIEGRLYSHDHKHQIWAFKVDMIIKGLAELKKHRAKTLKELSNG